MMICTLSDLRVLVYVRIWHCELGTCKERELGRVRSRIRYPWWHGHG